MNATTESAPAVSMAPRMRPATSSIASSHEASRNSPAPFAPVRISGVMTRSGAYTRRACCFTLAQIQPSVRALPGAASMSVMRPRPVASRVMVTASEQVLHDDEKQAAQE